MHIGIVNYFPCKKNWEPSNGAELRVSLLIDFLSHFPEYQVKVIGSGKDTFYKDEKNIIYEDFIFPSKVYLRVLQKIWWKLATNITWLPHPDPVLRYWLPKLDREYLKRYEDLIKWADIIIIEVIFPAYALIPIIKKYKKPVIIVNHNIEYELWVKSEEYSWLKAYVKNIEIKILSSADYPVFVSKDDAKKFENHGVGNINVIQNTVKAVSNAIDTGILATVKKQYNIGENSVIFVGGPAFMNVLAVQAIFDEIAPNIPEYNFFLIGGVCESSDVKRKSLSNVIKVGCVTEAEKNAFYHLCKICIVPLTIGSGSSIKLIEALSFGKLIISTTIGVRGVDFVDGIHGYICDDFSKYQDLIRSVKDEKMKDFEKNAKKLAERYDYKNVFNGYLEIINKIKIDYLA